MVVGLAGHHGATRQFGLNPRQAGCIHGVEGDRLSLTPKSDSRSGLHNGLGRGPKELVGPFAEQDGVAGLSGGRLNAGGNIELGVRRFVRWAAT